MNNVNDKSKINIEKSKKTVESSFCFFTWALKVEITIIIILSICFFIFNSIPNNIKFVMKYKIEKIFYKEVVNDERYSFEDIKLSVQDNKNLNENEKEFILYNLENEINENINYIDVKEVCNRLENLKIVYCKKYVYNDKNNEYVIQYPKFTNKGIAGRYNTFFNTIYLYEQIDYLPENYENQKYDFDTCNKVAFFHEINHVLDKNSKQNSSVLSEAINEMFTRKYLTQELVASENNRSGEAYESIIKYANSLTEILPEEIINEYKFNSKECILISGLLETEDDINEVYNFIDNIK